MEVNYENFIFRVLFLFYSVVMATAAAHSILIVLGVLAYS